MLLSARATAADALALTLASAGPPAAVGGEHEQPDEVEPADCCTDQAHRNLKRAEQSLRQKIGPAQQQRPHRRPRLIIVIPADQAQPACQLRCGLGDETDRPGRCHADRRETRRS